MNQNANRGMGVRALVQVQRRLGHGKLFCVHPEPPLHGVLPALALVLTLCLRFPVHGGEDLVPESQLHGGLELRLSGEPTPSELEVEGEARVGATRREVVQMRIPRVLHQAAEDSGDVELVGSSHPERGVQGDRLLERSEDVLGGVALPRRGVEAQPAARELRQPSHRPQVEGLGRRGRSGGGVQVHRDASPGGERPEILPEPLRG
mmetsp:Transcript_8589/g.29483  ORF Transcript_8589/g.29483 Transcript_8589/m.29483 type:complete len:206 (+) Transcript_8589:807-1424(+)